MSAAARRLGRRRRLTVPASQLQTALSGWTTNPTVKDWVIERALVHKPSHIHLCDGSDAENETLTRQMVNAGVLVEVPKRPGSYLARSPASDTARVEERTFIASDNVEDAPFKDTWRDPEKLADEMTRLFDGSMQGRTMYVVPFSMGPTGSPFSTIGIQVTDSPYVVASTRIMTRMGRSALEALGADSDFVPCVHSLGRPLKHNEDDSTWPCVESKDDKYIAHFPEQRRIWSYGSGYGGNALLGKKCLALRIASVMARDEGWLAEHMLIVGVTNPEGQKKYFAAAFPSACGKTNLAMMQATLPGWKIETVGDDIAWLRKGKDGRLWAINPEAGFFGVAPGTSDGSNPNAMATIEKNTVFTNVAMTDDGDVWWEGMTKERPAHLSSWQRRDLFADSPDLAAHANARFCAPASQCPTMDAKWEDPEGVPIDAILFGGRRSDAVPLVYQARSWQHGVFVGATMTSETTAAAAGKRGVLRSDPFAMLPFFGYNIGDYFAHWLSFTERTDEAKLPKIFHVNWFRKSKGRFLWPGFGDNVRVLEWLFKRCDEPLAESDLARDAPIGFMPKPGALNLDGLDVSESDMDMLLSVDKREWTREVAGARHNLETLGTKVPEGVRTELEELATRVGATTATK